jgi:hypothetical protein
MRAAMAVLSLPVAFLIAGQEKKPDDDPRPFTDTFLEEVKDFASAGVNPFFSLEPGYVLTLEGGGAKKEQLTITVLNETRVVGEVETRVVEERELVDGKVEEVSRNYFAISKKTNSVYYFGEDAGGAWLAGEKGCRFGMMMPGTVLLGARHYQEIAPGVAMDRAEVVSLTETVETPAGKFEKCLKVLETNPLEPGTKEFKLYAPGVGLIQEGGLKLVKYGKR